MENNDNNISLDDVMSVDDVANYLKMTRNFVYGLIKEGKLNCYKLSRKAWRIPKKSVQEYLNSLDK